MLSHLRVILAIALKDITDAIKNRTILVVLLMIAFILGMYRLLPALESLGQAPSVLVYDAGNSALVAQLERSQVVALWSGYASEAQLKEKLASGQVPELGLVIPADFDAGDTATLQGYVLHWVEAEDALALKQRVEGEIARITGRPVAIQLNIITTEPNSNGLDLLAAMGLSFAMLLVGVALVPNLMLEEKQAQTINALLVSPAGPVHVTLAKAVAGLLYAAVTAAVALAFYSQLVTQWALTTGVALCGALFAVSLGLLLGTLTHTRQQLTVWAWGAAAPLILPLTLSMLGPLLPGWLLSILRWIPSVALLEALRLSFSEQATAAHLGLLLVPVFACTVAFLAAVAWQIRRLDR